MQFIIADTFSKSLEKLDQQSSSLIKQAAFDFQMNPANPGFKFHKLERAKDKRFWSFRVTDDLRVIVHRTEETFMLCFAGHHDETVPEDIIPRIRQGIRRWLAPQKF